MLLAGFYSRIQKACNCGAPGWNPCLPLHPQTPWVCWTTWPECQSSSHTAWTSESGKEQAVGETSGTQEHLFPTCGLAASVPHLGSGQVGENLLALASCTNGNSRGKVHHTELSGTYRMADCSLPAAYVSSFHRWQAQEQHTLLQHSS